MPGAGRGSQSKKRPDKDEAEMSGVVAFSSCSQGVVSGDLCELQASLSYIAGYRPARATLGYLTQIQSIFILFIIT